MDTQPFTIKFPYQNNWLEAEIKPCCKEDNVVDYAVWMRGKLEFTVTRERDEPGSRWVVALKNADDVVDPNMVEAIGREIALKN